MKFKRNNSYYETWGTTDGERRDKRRCAYYNKGFCTLFERKCFSSSHCEKYSLVNGECKAVEIDLETKHLLDNLNILKKIFKNNTFKEEKHRFKNVKYRTVDEINGIKRLNAVICELYNYKTSSTMKCYICSEDIDELSTMIRLDENVPIALSVKKINVGEEFVINKLFKYKLLSKFEKKFIKKIEGV